MPKCICDASYTEGYNIVYIMYTKGYNIRLHIGYLFLNQESGNHLPSAHRSRRPSSPQSSSLYKSTGSVYLLPLVIIPTDIYGSRTCTAQNIVKYPSRLLMYRFAIYRHNRNNQFNIQGRPFPLSL